MAARLLGIQIDAAINPGNSGGPAFTDLDAGKVAGVAFSKNISSSTDNIGYIIPQQVGIWASWETYPHGYVCQFHRFVQFPYLYHTAVASIHCCFYTISVIIISISLGRSYRISHLMD